MSPFFLLYPDPTPLTATETEQLFLNLHDSIADPSGCSFNATAVESQLVESVFETIVYGVSLDVVLADQLLRELRQVARFHPVFRLPLEFLLKVRRQVGTINDS